MIRFLVFFSVLVFSIPVSAQTAPTRQASQNEDLEQQLGVKIAPDRRLIAVMTALEAAGVETTLTQAGANFRQNLKTDLSAVDENLKNRLASFVKTYREKARRQNPKVTDAELNAPFVSLAYALSPAPELATPTRTEDLPAELLDVLDFAPLVREFYTAAKLEAKMPQYLALYQAEGAKIRLSATKMAKEISDYLGIRPDLAIFERVKAQVQDPKNKNKKIEVTKPVERPRRFFVVPDLLAPKGAINFRAIGDDYFVIVPPETNLSISEARRAYLQFALDPLILRNAKDIATFRDGIKQLLDERRKFNESISPDIFLAVSRSLVAAVDARQIEFTKTQFATNQARSEIDKAPTAEAKRAVSAKLEAAKQIFADETALELSNAYERGAVLAFYFAQQLKGLEDSGFNISSSLRDIILSLNPANEKTRLAQFADARTRAVAFRRANSGKNATADESIKRAKIISEKLTAIELITNRKEFEEAEIQLKKLLMEFPGESRIFYALGRVGSLSAEKTFDENLRDSRLENALANFSNAINQATPQTDRALIQLSYVAIGRIYEFYEKKDAALQSFRQAEKLGNVEGGGLNEAKQGIARLTNSPKP